MGYQKFALINQVMTPQLLNQPAPNLVLGTLNGQTAPLSAYWADGHPLLLIFLRHLA